MIIRGGLLNNVSDILLNLFDYDRFPPSVKNLPAGLTINNQTVYPTFRYIGRDATSSVWKPYGYGQVLTLQAGTAPTYNNGSPLLGDVDDSVLLNGGGYYLANDTVFANITTEDLVVEFVGRFGVIDNGRYVIGKITGAVGWLIYAQSTTTLAMYLSDGVDTRNVISAAISDGIWNHFLFFMDRSGSGQCYINGVASGAAVNIAAVDSITNTNAMYIGGAAGTVWKDCISYLSLWKQSNWLDTHLQATVAKTRFHQLTGIYPNQARGTALASSFTRNSTAYLEKLENNGVKKLYQVGINWPRVCSKVDVNGQTFKGYLGEKTDTNALTFSESVGGNPALLTNITAGATSVICPNGQASTTVSMVETAVNNIHRLLRIGCFNTGGTGKTYSVCYVKASNRSFFRVTHTSNNSGNFAAYMEVNLTTGTVVSSGVNPDAWLTAATIIQTTIEPVGDGWYKVVLIADITIAAAAAHYISYNLCNAAGGTSYLGDAATDAVYLWGMQNAAGSYPTSYISSSAAAATRAADVLTFTMNDGNLVQGKGTLTYKYLIPSASYISSGSILTLSDGTKNNRIVSALKATTGSIEYSMDTSGVNQFDISGSTIITDGRVHTIKTNWKSADDHVMVDGVIQVATGSITVPSVTQLNFSDNNGTNQSNGLINNIIIKGESE